MKRLCLLLSFWAATVVWTALSAGQPLCDLTAIDQRAGEIAAALERCAVPLLPPITERDSWEALLATEQGAQEIKEALKCLEEPILPCPEEVYKEFFVNGNRSNAQQLLNIRYRRICTLAFAELLEGKGRFLAALEEALRDMCAFPSWVLPAHDPQGKVFDGTHMNSDLRSTELGASFAVLRQALLPVLSEETSALWASEIQRRVLDPYEKAVRGGIFPGMWWMTSSNNWNSACHGGTAIAALALCGDSYQKAWFLACAEYFITKYFMPGFTPDGYCSEGIDYWNYGFGEFAHLAEIACRQTGGEVNLYRTDRVRNTAMYGVRSMLKPGFFPSIADCSVTAQSDRRLIGLMSVRLGLGLSQYEREFRGRPILFRSDYLDTAKLLVVYYFQPEELGSAVDGTDENASDPLRGDFPDAGVLICRAPQDASGEFDPCQLCAFFKGGNNAEFHNHNDLGVYGILFGKNYLVVDPGDEVYTQRTFSPRRFEGELLNSYGHSVPRVNGTLQISGKEARAVVLEKSLTPQADTLTIDLASAYPEQGLQTLSRTYLFTRAEIGSPNEVTVSDRFVFEPEKAGTFESPLVTFARWTTKIVSEDKSVYTGTLREGDDAVEVTVRGTAGGRPLPLEMSRTTVARDDPSAPNKPQRIAFTARCAGGQIEFVFRPVLAENTEK